MLSEQIFLVGMPGSGKSTVGKILAQYLKMPFFDLDTELEIRAEASIAQIFSDHGEAYFRCLETEVLQELVQKPPAVIALGGGTCESPVNREIIEGNKTIFLDVTAQTLARRLHGDRSRPLLQGTELSTTLQQTRATRQQNYRDLATCTVATDEAPPARVASEILEYLLGNPLLLGQVENDLYGIILHDNLMGVVSSVREKIKRNQYSAAVILHAPCLSAAATQLAKACNSILPVHLLELTDGEECKSIGEAEKVYAKLAQMGIGRDSVLIALGGGATTDFVGFIASTWARGIAVIHIPTTLLAMVDAAIGGKTALNIPAGKNLIGTFYAPEEIYLNPEFLKGLAETQIRSGLAEIIKCAYVLDKRELRELLQSGPFTPGELIEKEHHEHLQQLIMLAVEAKNEVVAEDYKEGSSRELLNFGHTLGHALEVESQFAISHGYAVAAGMVYAAILGEELGITPAEITAQIRKQLKIYGLPTSPTGNFDVLYKIMIRDKKSRQGKLRFVVPEASYRGRTVTITDQQILFRAWDRCQRAGEIA